MIFFAQVATRTLDGLDYSVLFLYFGLNLGIGWWCSRRRQSSSGDFFLGGGRVAWWAGAISFFATQTSSLSFMALPAVSFAGDWLPFGSCPAQALAGFFVGFVFVGLLRRLNLTTIFGYLEQRFDRNVRLLGGGLAVLLKVSGRMSVVMLLPAMALSTVTGLNVYMSIFLTGAVTTIYAMKGGFEAVVWTDVMQAVVMFGGLALTLHQLAAGVDGGFAGIVHTGAELGKFHAISWKLDLTQPTVWVFVGMFLGHIFTHLADQPLMQRMLASSDVRHAQRTVLLGNAIGIVSTTMVFFLGTALFVYYRAHPDPTLATLPKDTLVPYFIVNHLPRGIVGLIVAGLFASTMGALSSTINAAAAIIVEDFQRTLRPDSTPAQQIRLARLATLVCGVLATGTAVFLAGFNDDSLWDRYLKLTALIGGGFPGVFALGMLTRRANAPGVIIGIVASIGVTLLVQTFTHTSSFLHIFVAIASCAVIGYLASLAFAARTPSRDLRGLVIWEPRAPVKTAG
jgi:SSS family solute:Na+ symporter